MTPVGRAWLLVGLNVLMTIVVLLGRSGDGHGSGGNEMLEAWVSTLVYTNVTGGPAILAGPWVVARLVAHRWPLSWAVLATTLAFAAAGCLAAQALLVWGGIAVPGHFWQQYLHNLRGALLLSLVFASGAFAYTSMRERLRLAEERLQEKEVAEQRAHELATEARLRSLESRLQPHFLFNTLNSISALIAIDPARAEKMVGRLAALLRSSLDTTAQPLIPLRQELAMVEDYVDIEGARFGDKLQGRVDVPAELRDAQVPPLSVQSLVENAVKHGIAPQRSGGEVSVSASAEDGQLRIEVSDTGPGFDLSAVRAGHGLDCLVGRLDALFSDRAHVHVYRREGRCVVEMVLPRS
jgi:sensor histidine kinase YesM